MLNPQNNNVTRFKKHFNLNVEADVERGVIQFAAVKHEAMLAEASTHIVQFVLSSLHSLMVLRKKSDFAILWTYNDTFQVSLLFN